MKVATSTGRHKYVNNVGVFDITKINRVMKTSWHWNNLQTYQFFVDGKPTPASPVYVRPGFSENIAELARALHFGHKNGDGSYLSLLTDHGHKNDEHRSSNISSEDSM